MKIQEVALLYFGTPYVWAGNDIGTGLDCSGFVCEVLRSVGIIGNRDYSAQSLYKCLMGITDVTFYGAEIYFFGKDVENITHVAIELGNGLMIEAGGEGRVASDKGYVRIRPLANRGDLVARVML